MARKITTVKMSDEETLGAYLARVVALLNEHRRHDFASIPTEYVALFSADSIVPAAMRNSGAYARTYSDYSDANSDVWQNNEGDMFFVWQADSDWQGSGAAVFIYCDRNTPRDKTCVMFLSASGFAHALTVIED